MFAVWGLGILRFGRLGIWDFRSGLLPGIWNLGFGISKAGHVQK
jgi:hypothetical protein